MNFKELLKPGNFKEFLIKIIITVVLFLVLSSIMPVPFLTVIANIDGPTTTAIQFGTLINMGYGGYNLYHEGILRIWYISLPFLILYLFVFYIISSLIVRKFRK